MAAYWLSSDLPLAVTSLLPVVLFPLLGLMDSKTVAAHYMSVRYTAFKSRDDVPIGRCIRDGVGTNLNIHIVPS